MNRIMSVFAIGGLVSLFCMSTCILPSTKPRTRAIKAYFAMRELDLETKQQRINILTNTMQDLRWDVHIQFVEASYHYGEVPKKCAIAPQCATIRWHEQEIAELTKLLAEERKALAWHKEVVFAKSESTLPSGSALFFLVALLGLVAVSS